MELILQIYLVRHQNQVNLTAKIRQNYTKSNQTNF